MKGKTGNKAGKLIYGVAVNDTEEPVRKTKTVNGITKVVWICPLYVRWFSMIVRCYSPLYLKNHPSYIGCSVCEEWLYFSNFKAWMEQKDWQGKSLDKDLLIYGNKIYSPDTCVFISAKVNSFLTESRSNRGEWPIGVDKRRDKFRASCWGIKENRQVFLGLHDTPEDAHLAWLAFKLEQAYILADEVEDERISNAIINRYKSKYKNYSINWMGLK